MMKRVMEAMSLTFAIMLAVVAPVLANAPAGEGAPDYSGFTWLYYVLIGGILVYGVYDAFLKKS